MRLPENYTIIFLSDYGSNLYGTANSKSDSDFKGVFIPPLKEILLGSFRDNITWNTSTTKNTSEDIDIQLLSLHKFMSLLLAGDTLAIDLLHASFKKGSTLITSKWWDIITKYRKNYYSKNFKAFLGYAKNQAYQYGMKGDKLKVIEKVLGVFKKYSMDKDLTNIWKELPVTEHSNFIGKNSNGIEQYTVCGKIFQETVSFEYAYNIVSSLYFRYGERSKHAMDNNGVDFKALSHALRACYEVEEIIETGNLVFPLRSSQFLREVKEGLHDYKYIVNLLEDKIKYIEGLINISTLPDRTSKELVDQVTLEVLKDFYKLG